MKKILLAGAVVVFAGIAATVAAAADHKQKHAPAPAHASMVAPAPAHKDAAPKKHSGKKHHAHAHKAHHAK